MKSLQEYVDADPRLIPGRDTVLTEEEFRQILTVAAPIFREGSLRDAIPTTIHNMPGVTKARTIKVIDQDDIQHGMSGTGGTFTRLDKSLQDDLAYALWQNVEVPWREQESSAQGGYFDILKASGEAIGQKLVEGEARLIATGLGPIAGISASAGDTYAAGAAWTTQGQFWKDVIKARGRLKNNKIPVAQLACLVNPTDGTNAWQTFTNTATPQNALVQLEKMLPGGMHETTFVPAGKAYFYAKIPQVLELNVWQDLGVKPLPMIDEDPRIRGRVIDSVSIKRSLGIVEVSGI